MAINWNNIRPFNQTQNDGFEELVCQLAGKEKIEGQKKFTRIGKPDGGKECFWELSNGDEHMWQAKYFTSSFEASQWAQIDDSVHSAIDNHPKLVTYYISIPYDRPDPKVKGKKSMLDKWNEKILEWQQYAMDRGMKVAFEYWGSHELVTRLSKPENEGLRSFWFNEDEFTEDWLDYKNEESIHALGARYTEELNVEVPIAKLFDGLSRNKNFEEETHKQYDELLKKYRSLHLSIADDSVKTLQGELKSHISDFRRLYEFIRFSENEPIPFDQLVEQLKAMSKKTSVIDERLEELRKEAEKDKEKIDKYSRPYSNEMGDLSAFARSIYSIRTFFQSSVCALSNHPYLLITGDAGIGKSHLLADIIHKRKVDGRSSLLLLGEKFTSLETPWRQILANQLRVTCKDEIVFLGALNAKAESEQKRFILFIDAINEGEGRRIWPGNIKSFIASVRRFPWLGLVTTVRSSYEALVVPLETIDKSVITRVEHEGFAGQEYEATQRFFHHFKITQPSSPLLHPEFGNPLFLKLFCLGLHNQGKHEVPSGYEGISTIIHHFIDSIDYKLSKQENLYYEERKRLVRKAVNAVVKRMIEDDVNTLLYEDADAIIDDIFNGACANKEPFLQRLISEGVFNKDIVWSEEGSTNEIITLAYQRFQDHLIVFSLLDKYQEEADLIESFHSGSLHELVKDKLACWHNQNIIEALSIQIPERTGKELFEVAPHIRKFNSVTEAFIQSLIWRKTHTIGDSAKKYVEEIIWKDNDLRNQFLNAIIATGMKAGFYFNADYLHNLLLPSPLPKRDASWTIWLQNKYGEGSSLNGVKRLIDWAWSETDQTHVSDDSMLLCCTLLGWFLTSANRYLRDAATKALVSILQNRIHLIIPLLTRFKDVNDPYVSERLYAAVYGSALRTGQTGYLANISKHIYSEIFDKQEVYPHILLRDYARGVIEYTLHKAISLKIDTNKIRPPYKSKPIPKRLPSNAIIDRKFAPKDKTGHYSQSHWGAGAIIDSMTTEYGRGVSRYGDFGRYTFEYAFDGWPVNADLLSNYAIQRIWELGYDPLVFSQFDCEQGSGGTGQNERVGKKYQWIVLHELLARVADNFAYGRSANDDETADKTYYNGPWEMHIRDIDPTFLIKETGAERFKHIHTRNWWFNMDYAPWNKTHEDWTDDKEDLPQPEKIINVTDEKGEAWLWLEMYPEWGEPKPLGEDSYDNPSKRLWYQIRSYLVRKGDLQKIEKAFKRDFHRGELPEAKRRNPVFDKEYYWSPAFYDSDEKTQKENCFKPVFDQYTGKKIGELCLTTEEFSWEAQEDGLKEGAIVFYKLAAKIFDGLSLIASSLEGVFTDESGKTICFDPSVHNKSLSGLLIRKKEFLEWLEKEGLSIFWTVIGEKQILGNHRSKDKYYGRLNISGLYKCIKDELAGKLRFQTE